MTKKINSAYKHDFDKLWNRFYSEERNHHTALQLLQTLREEGYVAAAREGIEGIDVTDHKTVLKETGNHAHFVIRTDRVAEIDVKRIMLAAVVRKFTFQLAAVEEEN